MQNLMNFSNESTTDVLFQNCQDLMSSLSNLMFVKIARALVYKTLSSNPTPGSNPDRLVGNYKSLFTKEAVWIPSPNGLQIPRRRFEDIIITLCNIIKKEATLTIKNNHVQFIHRNICIFVYFRNII